MVHFNATTLRHSDASEWAPSTASDASVLECTPKVRQVKGGQFLERRGTDETAICGVGLRASDERSHDYRRARRYRLWRRIWGSTAVGCTNGRSRYARADWKRCWPGSPAPGRPGWAALKSAILNEGEAARRRIAELERKIGEQQADLDFFRQALRHVKARQQAAGVSGARRSGKSSKR